MKTLALTKSIELFREWYFFPKPTTLLYLRALEFLFLCIPPILYFRHVVLNKNILIPLDAPYFEFLLLIQLPTVLVILNAIIKFLSIYQQGKWIKIYQNYFLVKLNWVKLVIAFSYLIFLGFLAFNFSRFFTF